eukprot:scaffold257326_cov24-Tisochrysis_lutea.AAC.2
MDLSRAVLMFFYLSPLYMHTLFTSWVHSKGAQCKPERCCAHVLLSCSTLHAHHAYSLDAPQKEHIVELGVNCCVPEAPCVPAGVFSC